MVIRVFISMKMKRGYCTWGWFEDNILNTFFGL